MTAGYQTAFWETALMAAASAAGAQGPIHKTMLQEQPVPAPYQRTARHLLAEQR